MSSRKVRRSRTLRAISLGAGTNGVLSSLTATRLHRVELRQTTSSPRRDAAIGGHQIRQSRDGHSRASSCTNAALVPMPCFHCRNPARDAARSAGGKCLQPRPGLKTRRWLTPCRAPDRRPSSRAHAPPAAGSGQAHRRWCSPPLPARRRGWAGGRRRGHRRSFGQDWWR